MFRIGPQSDDIEVPEWLQKHPNKSGVVSDPAAAPYLDRAHGILATDTALTDDQRADAWDVFHQAKNPGELARSLSSLKLPDNTKRRLLDAKTVTSTPADRVHEALDQMKSLPSSVLELAENFPTAFKAFVEGRKDK